MLILCSFFAAARMIRSSRFEMLLAAVVNSETIDQIRNCMPTGGKQGLEW